VTAEQLLKLILRFVGTAALLALIFVAAPFAWMESIHSSLGMGRLPDTPVVGYLARSTSAFYALLGGLFWALSLDPGRYRRILIYLGAALAFFGAALLVIDLSGGMPWFWTAWEGPYVMVMGTTILLLSRGRRTRDGR